MKTKIFCVILFLLLVLARWGQANNTVDRAKNFIGVSSGVNHQGYYSGDIYYGFYSNILNNKIEINTGYSYFGKRTKFDNYDRIIYVSHGVYCDANYFLLPNFFTGLRLAIDGNFVDKESQQDYTLAIGKKPPLFFLGKTFLFNIGFAIPVSEWLEFRICGQTGFHNYKIQTGWEVGNNSSPIPAQFRDTHAKELQLKLIGNIKGALLIKF
jgi:hypothetical protein